MTTCSRYISTLKSNLLGRKFFLVFTELWISGVNVKLMFRKKYKNSGFYSVFNLPTGDILSFSFYDLIDNWQLYYWTSSCLIMRIQIQIFWTDYQTLITTLKIYQAYLVYKSLFIPQCIKITFTKQKKKHGTIELQKFPWNVF